MFVGQPNINRQKEDNHIEHFEFGKGVYGNLALYGTIFLAVLFFVIVVAYLCNRAINNNIYNPSGSSSTNRNDE